MGCHSIVILSKMLNNWVMLRLCFGNSSVIVLHNHDKGTTFSAFKQVEIALFVRNWNGKNSLVIGRGERYDGESVESRWGGDGE